MKNFPAEYLDLLKDETKAFLYLGTIMSDGAPQVTPIWFNVSGDYILINSAAGRIKDKNMRKRPDVSLCISDPKDPYRYIQIRGKVVEVTTAGADEHIDALAFKYRGLEKYPFRKPGEQRVTYKVEIVKVAAR